MGCTGIPNRECSRPPVAKSDLKASTTTSQARNWLQSPLDRALLFRHGKIIFLKLRCKVDKSIGTNLMGFAPCSQRENRFTYLGLLGVRGQGACLRRLVQHIYLLSRTSPCTVRPYTIDSKKSLQSNKIASARNARDHKIPE